MVPSMLFPSRGKFKILFLISLLLLSIIMTFSARAWRESPTSREQPDFKIARPESSGATAPIAVPTSRPEVERVTVTESGFDPDEMTRPAGQVVLAIDNRSGLDEVWLRLDREGGERLIDAHVEREKLDWRGSITLARGRYRLTEANHSDWLCLITVRE